MVRSNLRWSMSRRMSDSVMLFFEMSSSASFSASEKPSQAVVAMTVADGTSLEMTDPSPM